MVRINPIHTQSSFNTFGDYQITRNYRITTERITQLTAWHHLCTPRWTDAHLQHKCAGHRVWQHTLARASTPSCSGSAIVLCSRLFDHLRQGSDNTVYSCHLKYCDCFRLAILLLASAVMYILSPVQPFLISHVCIAGVHGPPGCG